MDCISFGWNIDSFDCLAANGSGFILRSQNFKCLQKNQTTEWYLSLDYFPNLPGRLRAGIFLVSAVPQFGIKARVSIFLTDVNGNPALEMGSASRTFKATDPASMFRRFLEKQSQTVSREVRSDSHEWFSPISLKQLWGNKDILLSDNTLRIRTILDVDESRLPGARTSRSQYFQAIPRPKQFDSPRSGYEPEGLAGRPRTHTSDHSLLTQPDHIVQYSNHSPFGSQTFRSRRPQTARGRAEYSEPPHPLTRDGSRPATRQTQRPYTAVENRRHTPGTRIPKDTNERLNEQYGRPVIRAQIRRVASSHDILTPKISESRTYQKNLVARRSSSETTVDKNKFRSRTDSNYDLGMAYMSRPGQGNQRPQTTRHQGNEPQRPKSAKQPQGAHRFADLNGVGVIPRPQTRGDPARDNFYNAPIPPRPKTPRPETVNQRTDRCRPRAAYTPHEHAGLDISNTDCAIICGNKKFNVHSIILSDSSPFFASVLEDARAAAVQQSSKSTVPTIRTENVEPAVMRKMLDYVYSGHMESHQSSGSGQRQEPEGPSKLTVDASRKLLQAAHKYQINNLKDECLTKLLEDLSMNTVGDLAVLVHEFDADPEIKKQIKLFLRSKWILLQRNPAFRKLYTTNPGAFQGVFSTDDKDEE